MKTSMNLAEVSKLACTRGCSLQMAACDGVLLYWIENLIFISKPFEQLEELVSFMLNLPLCSQESFHKPETIFLSGIASDPLAPIAA